MISDFIRGDILDAPEAHIVFAVSTEGYTQDGLAGQISRLYWPELATIGRRRLGEALHHKHGDKTYHALVCHSVRPGGWEHAGKHIEQSLELVILPKYEPIAIALMGTGMVGQLGGVHIYDILGSIARSPQRFVVYRRF